MVFVGGSRKCPGRLYHGSVLMFYCSGLASLRFGFGMHFSGGWSGSEF